MAGGWKLRVVVGIIGDLLKYKMAKDALLGLQVHAGQQVVRASTRDC